MVLVGFAMFNFFMNMGPNATTFALPAEVFPDEIRAAGHGFAAASAKFGAALGVFLFPILLDDIGTGALLFIVAGCCLVALARDVGAADRADGQGARRHRRRARSAPAALGPGPEAQAGTFSRIA